MTVTVATFRQHFPEFSSTVNFPEPQVTYWLTLAGLLLNSGRWGNLLDLGTELFVAHNIVLEAKAQKEAKKGGIPGVTTGAVSGKSVDKVSVNYDVSSSIQANAGHWNLTIYGTRLAKLFRIVGAGPVYVGAGYSPTDASAWPGPWQPTIPNPSG